MPADSPPSSIPKHTPLFDLVFQRIEKSRDGSIPFSDYMEMALYHPEFGYYADPEARPVGRGGDFFTSVSVGETFGLLLAHRIDGARRDHFGAEAGLSIVEQGAHDGQLARDILGGLEEIGAAPGIDYRIVEPRGAVRGRLRERFEREGLGERVSVVESAAAAAASQGVFLCNELLDAFPVRRLRFEAGEWREWRVGLGEDGFRWVSRPLPAALAGVAAEWGGDFPEGYVTEIRPAVDDWMAEVAGLFERGLWWVVDYGFEAADYYSPARREGTLRCYREHSAIDDPFVAPGEVDITAHVDFTHLGRAAIREGLRVEPLTDQHHFLTEAARPWLLSLEGAPPEGAAARRLRQFQTLTHPTLMGQQFKVAQFSRGLARR